MYTLPKVWQARVPKYWEKFMPVNYPTSSSEFSLKFASEEDKAAVAEFEETLGTEDSPVAEAIGEENFVSGYVGTYDVSGEAGVRTLLSPEKIETEDQVAAFHYNGESWDLIEDTELVNGYLWGTLEEFSPIAVVIYKKDIEYVEPDFVASGKWIVANGNPVQAYTDPEDGKIKVKNLSSGKVLEYDGCNDLCGGSVDGTKVSTTNISVIGVNDEANFAIYAGSYCWDNEDENITTTNDSINLTVMDSKIRAVTGAGGRVRVNEYNLKFINSSAKSHIATGETWNTKAKKDANKTGNNLGLNSVAWLKQANIIIKDGSYTELLFTGGNTGFTYTDSANLIVKDSKIDWLVCGGSNGRSRYVSADVANLEGNFFQTNNRGPVDYVVAKINDSTIPNLFVFGDATDKSVTGTTGFVSIDIGKGTYEIKLGTQGGEPATNVDPVGYVKYSRSANVTISDEDKQLLGQKLIVK